MADIGDVYTVMIYFKGQEGDYKPRPVVVLNTLGNNQYTIVEITSIKPKESPTYFDQFKEEIKEWQQAELDQPSWAKCYKGNIHNISENRLHEYIGEMDSEDFKNVAKNIYKNNH